MRALLRANAWSAGFLAAGIVVIAILPSFLGYYETRNMAQVGMYFIALIGLNIVTGYSGQISLGQGAFMGIGAYTTAYLVTDHGLGVWWTVPVAAAVAGIVGFLFGFPALRLHGPYLALATFALAVAFVELARSERFSGVTGGGQGLFFGLPTAPYYETWGIALGLLLVGWFLLSGKLGRSLRAVRDAELAAVSSGLNPAVFKTVAFGLSAAYAGVAGALLAIMLGSVNAISFIPLLSITLLVGTALGGFGALFGTLFGALFVVYAQTKAEDFSKNDWWTTLHLPNPQEAPSVLYGLFLLALLFVMPGGAAQLILRLKGLLLATKRRYTRPTLGEGASTSTRSD
jgi:branched-chain amino acid transport system permease protein